MFIPGRFEPIDETRRRLKEEGADISFCHFKDDVKATSVNDKITGYNRKCFSQNIDIGKKDNCDDFFQKSLEA